MASKGMHLNVGTPVPWFAARSPLNPEFRLDGAAGRYIVLCFFGSADAPASRRVLDEVLQQRSTFDGRNVAFFGISVDPDDERLGRVQEVIPGIRVLWDFDRNVSRLFGAARRIETDAKEEYRPFSVLLDERLRVVVRVPLADPERHMAQLMEALLALPPLEPAPMTEVPAPILNVPRIFEPEVCQALIRYYEEHGGGESGFMRDVGGKTVGVYDHSFKRRRDQEIADEQLRKACMVRIHDRLLPEISKSFQFQATRIERYIVACYDALTGGHFRAHRDNTTRATAHRKFAVSLVLNTGEFEGGDLRFPEFGRRGYCPPAGGAIVFSCSLLHELTPLSRGKRYAFLPFLYDEAAARIRQENARFLAADDPTP
jgi:peroxiredoxin/predicted 2-oxoglutarate/Fe(II)-dependent dioxygenase YbiX